MKRILIACEFSGTVREAFKARGWDAWSCDLRPTEIPGQHIEGDVIPVLSQNWDMMIGHPPCTHLSNSGARWGVDHWVKRKNGNRWHDGSAKRKARGESVEFFKTLLNAQIPRICLENPMSMAFTLVAPMTQIIEPWQFGHGEKKQTWLWLKNLPPLLPTNIVDRRESRIHKMPPGPEREKERSKTYPGIAKAMADQWSNLA
jgi:hypothetical protein